MRAENLIFGFICLFWGVASLAWRGEILSLAREGGRGLRDIRLLRPLLYAASALSLAVGIWLVLKGLWFY